MVKVGLLVQVSAKPGKEDDMQNMLEGALDLANQEAGTIVWFAIKMDDSTFGIFDAFDDDEGRQTHLNGPIAAALVENAPALFSEDPDIKPVDVLASKVPG